MEVLVRIGTYGSCNESSIISMSGIPVTTVKYPDRIIAMVGKAFEESNEAAFVVKLRGLVRCGVGVQLTCLELRT
jgi:hypothetical protein